MNRFHSSHKEIILLCLLTSGSIYATPLEDADDGLEIPDCGELESCSYWIDGSPASSFNMPSDQSKDEQESLSIELRDKFLETRDFLEAEPKADVLHRLRPSKWRVGAGFGAYRNHKSRLESAAMKGHGTGLGLSIMRRLADYWGFLEFRRERENRMDRLSHTIVESRFDSLSLGLQTLRSITNTNSALPLHLGVNAAMIGMNHKGSTASRSIGSDPNGNIAVEIEKNSASAAFFGLGAGLSVAMPAADGVWICTKIDVHYFGDSWSSEKHRDFGKYTAYITMLYGF